MEEYVARVKLAKAWLLGNARSKGEHDAAAEMLEISAKLRLSAAEWLLSLDEDAFIVELENDIAGDDGLFMVTTDARNLFAARLVDLPPSQKEPGHYSMVRGESFVRIADGGAGWPSLEKVGKLLSEAVNALRGGGVASAKYCNANVVRTVVNSWDVNRGIGPDETTFFFADGSGSSRAPFFENFVTEIGVIDGGRIFVKLAFFDGETEASEWLPLDTLVLAASYGPPQICAILPLGDGRPNALVLGLSRGASGPERLAIIAGKQADTPFKYTEHTWLNHD